MIGNVESVHHIFDLRVPLRRVMQTYLGQSLLNLLVGILDLGDEEEKDKG